MSLQSGVATRAYSMSAYVCPRCFGFENIAGNVWVDPHLSAADRIEFLQNLSVAQWRVASVYGKLESDPVVLVCARRDCDRSFSNTMQAVNSGWQVVNVGSRGRSATVLTHELAHAELQKRAGLRAYLSRAYPAWFDEGLAVLISRDERFLETAGFGPPRCKVERGATDQNLPERAVDWITAAGNSAFVYGTAACRVAHWYTASGRNGLLAMIDELREGEPFAVAFARDRARRLPSVRSSIAQADQ